MILDLEHDEANRIKILLKDDKERIVTDKFDPYFYLIPEKSPDKTKEKILKEFSGEVKKITTKDNVMRIVVNAPGDVPKIRERVREHGETREDDILYAFRYLIDNNIYASRYYDIETNGKIKYDEVKDKTPKLKMCAFDLEVYNPQGAPRPDEDPIILISYCDDEEKTVFYWRNGESSEREIIQKLVDKIKSKNIDVVVGYNSNAFDFPYLKKRAKVLGVDLDLGRDGSQLSVKPGGFRPRTRIFGRVNLDAYESVEFLTRIGALRLPKNDLESVYKEFFGTEKLDIDTRNIYKYWEEGGKNFEILKEYNKQDSIAAFEIGKEMLPLYMELSKIVGLPAYDVSRMASSQMVEWLLIREAHRRGILVPRRPHEDDVRQRFRNPIKGAFVKLPESGLHEKIFVCDFKSLYPSLIISHNVGPSTLNCDCCKDANVAPEVGHRFCKKKPGLIPKILGDLISARGAVKQKMKKHKKGSTAYKMLNFRQQALKIVANSAYGYLGYARARWYSRESAESVTAWGRHYIQESAKIAEESGFHVLYMDTDSIFLKLEDKTQKDAEDFVKKINKKLPEEMELEVQGYYSRGIFVSRRGGGAAKKRYALIREDGTVEIKGFEFVRRDWANIAKTTQEKVIEAVLKKGKPGEAVEAVKKVVDDVRNRRVDIDDLIIYTQVIRKVSSYEQQAPHVKAAKRLIKAGYKVKPGSVVEYVVTRGSGSISDRAIPIQLLKNKEYDVDYYIDNQILPAVMKILREVGVKEDDLRHAGEQAGLKKWF